MVSPSKPNHSRVASQQHSHKSKIIRGPKPLINFKFYLDIEKHHIESKIEKNIRELGGSIEFFFDKEVTHFVTDKQIERDGKLLNAHHIQHSSRTHRTTSTSVVVTPHTPQQQNPASTLLLSELTDTASPNGTSNDARATCSKPKSRADAMLQRSRTVQQQQQRQPASFDHSTAKSQSPVQLAQSWDKHIWTTEYALRFLERITQFIKRDPRSRHHNIGVGVVGGGGGGNASPNTIGIVSSKTKSSHQASFASTTAAIGVGGAVIGHGAAKSRTANAKHLNGDYIKIESTEKHYRPYYQEIKCWPTLNLNVTDGYCPFQVASDKAKLNNTINNNKYNKTNKPVTTTITTATTAATTTTTATAQLKRRGPAVENITKLGNRQTSGVHGATAVAAGTFVSTAVDLKHHSSRSAALSVKSHLQINDTNQSTMTRKTRNKRDATTVDGIKTTTVTNDIIKRSSDKCGYCEKCRVEYESLSMHLQSNEHQSFVKNSDNYLALDKLINSGANVETFLKMNSSSRSPQKHTATSPTSTKSASPIDPIAVADSNGQLTTATANHVNHNHSNDKASKNSIRRSSDGSMKMDVDEDAIPINEIYPRNEPHIAKYNRETYRISRNGTAGGYEHDRDHDDEPLSPKSINSSRDKLPKYSPPMTRRSQNKTNKSPVKSQSSPTKSTFERFNFLVETKDFFSNPAKSPRIRSNCTDIVSNRLDAHAEESTTTTAKAADANDTNMCKRNEATTRVDDDSPQVKRLFRALPRYKVVDGAKALTKNNVASMTSATETTTTTTTPTMAASIAHDFENSASIDMQSEPLADRQKDPTTGIIVKFKRVRESELSKLTYEADNFMFPKQRDDQPTDEDRQTTSERAPADATSDIVSSELDEARLAASPTRKSNTFPDESDQFTSSGRRKKRRTQYDSFMAETTRNTKKKQQSSTEDVRKGEAADSNEPTTSNVSPQRLAKVTRRGTKSAKAAAAAAAATATESTNCEPASSDNGGGGSSNSALDSDGKYNGGSILSTDFFKTLKFSFERVPTNEPWYLTFQRQDECHERIFEYWGNTAYRKLPFELGPLPALQSDCCILSKLAALKATKQQKNRRGRGGRQKSKNLCETEASTADGEDSATAMGIDGNAPNATTTTTVTRSMPKTDANSLPMSTTASRKTSTSEAPKHFARSNSQNMWKLESFETMPPKKRAMLLDAFGQPRKSPREHASTLAILSSLVQQKRKRLREMNGGISPEKMPNYNSSSAANGTPADGTDNDELDDDDFCDNDSYHTKNADLDIDDQQSRGSTSNRTLQPMDATKGSTLLDAETNDISSINDKVFRLRKGKRRQTASTSSHNEVTDVKTEDATTTAAAIDSGKESAQSKEIKFPKMPVDDYVDPNKVARQIEDLLSSCYTDPEPEIDDIGVNVTEDSDDLILVNTPKDFVEIVNSVKEGPLTYRSFVNVNKKTGLSSFIQRGKKRHINKTGWPSLPKKRLAIKKEKLEGSCAEEDTNVVHSNTEDDDIVSTNGGAIAGTDGDRIDISSQLKGDEFFIQARRDLKTPTPPSLAIKEENFDETEEDVDDGADGGDEDDDFEESPFCTDNAVNNVFASSSEKAENSDIFTVSSDSLDTTDLIPVKNTVCETKSTVRSPLAADDDESVNESDDESSSDAPTIAEIVRLKKALPTSATVLQTTTVTNVTSKMETRAKGERSPIIKGKLSHLRLQPVVCMKKICEKDLYRRTYGKSLSPQKSSPSTSPKKSPTKSGNEPPSSPPPVQQQQLTVIAYTNAGASTNNRTSTSPKTKISPRKLRKPRGRWYRER